MGDTVGHGIKVIISQKPEFFFADFFLIFASEAGLLESKEKKICIWILALKKLKTSQMRLLEASNFFRF